jgi:hypothetical protein
MSRCVGAVLGGALVSLLLAACSSPSSTGAKTTVSKSPISQATTLPTTTGIASTISTPSCGVPSQWALYDGNGLRFEHPACWTPVHHDEVSTVSTSLIDLSNEPMHHPCTTNQFSSVCGWPLTKLSSEGVLVRWSSNGSPGWHLGPGTPLTVGGLPASEQVSQPGICSSIGADETITVEVAFTPASDYYSLWACLDGPDVTQAASQVQRMLASTTFTSR